MGAKTVTLCLDNDMKFKGNFLTCIPANHSVTFTEPYMVSKGIGSWNIHTFASATNDDENKKEIERTLTEYRTGKPYWEAFDDSDNLFGLAENICTKMEYEYDAWRVVHWSESNGKNVSKTYTKSELYSYIKYYEEGATGNASYDREIDRIKSSVGSCVVFGFGPEEPEKKGDEYVKPWKYYAKLFINDINTDTVPNASDERVLIPKHNNMVAMTPRKSTGREISYKPSQDTHLTVNKTDGEFEVGVNYPTLKTVSDNNKDMIAAGVDYYYDNNTGMYHSGTVQILAILLEDLPSASITAPDIDNSSLKSTDVANSRAWYNKSGQYYSGNHSTAIAMPISMENGNPNTYGPDITLCEGAREIDKVRAVNRSNNKFDQGQTVMLNKINGEWIVTEFGEITSEPSVPKIGKWGFSKYMANSDCFFRDTLGNRLYPEDAQALAIYRCWSTLPEGNTIAKYNAKSYVPVNPGQGVSNINFCTYAQCSSFDYKLTNPKNLIAHEEETQMEVWDFPLDTFHSFFGPLFTYGYTAGSVTSLGGKTLEAQGYAEDFVDISNHPIGYRDVKSLYDTSRTYQNNRLVHCPPDIATCTYAGSELGHPVYKSEVYIDYLNSKDDVSTQFANLIAGPPEFRSDQAYLWSDQGESALIPQNNSSILWMPLGLCTALGDDINTKLKRGTGGSNIRDDRENNGSEFRYWRNQTLINNFGEGANIGRLHKWYDRNTFTKYNQADLASLGEINTVYSSSRFSSNSGGTCIPYFTYLKRGALDKPMRALRIFEDNNNDAVSSDYRSGDLVGPGVVGISTARVAVGRRNGGPLNINIGGMYGRIGTLMSTGVGTVDYFLPPGANQAGTASVSGGLPKDSGGKATWGSADDKIYSFGGFNIFAMVWDYWPTEYTIFIPEYFMVLHFNAGVSGDTASSTLGQIATDNEGNAINATIYNLDYDSDFRVPTIMDNGYKTYAVEPDEIIDYMVDFAPSEFWHVNTQRRGICVTGGYSYPRVVVGLGDDWEIRSDGEAATVSGSGFGAGDEIDIDGGAKVRVLDVDENGAIRDIEFVTTTVEGTSVTYLERGSGFTPDDFPQGDSSTTPAIPDGKLIYLNSTSAGGTPATILWKSGLGYEQVVYDEGCQRRDGFTGPQRITPGSGAGNATVGDKWSKFDYTTTIQLNPNPDTGGVKDNYEVFFFCQNDVDLIPEHAQSTAIEDWMADAINPYCSYMTMDIS